MPLGNGDDGKPFERVATWLWVSFALPHHSAGEEKISPFQA